MGESDWRRVPGAPAGAAAAVPGAPHGPAVPRRATDLPSTHRALICVALPGLAISSEHGQLTAQGLEGIYRGGRRLLSRCQVRVAGREPLAVQARMIAADRARFVSTVRASVEAGPDPEVVVERIRHADGTERITLRSSASRRLRLPLEVSVGTDLAELGAVAAGSAGRELRGTVHDSGMRWSSEAGYAVVTATPTPTDTLASAGLLRWELDLPPGGSCTVELKLRADTSAGAPVPGSGRRLFGAVQAQGDDARVGALLRACVDDLHALTVRDPQYPLDASVAAGAPWRCGPAPAEALAAARMALPLGTRLAAGTLRGIARTQLTSPGPEFGSIPGPLRHAGPHLPPSSTGMEATLQFPVLLAEARRWGLAEQDVTELLPTAERCLRRLRTAASGDLPYVADPGPGGPLRCETQAHAHRAALLGADLLDTYGRPGGAELRDWAEELRRRFRDDFWVEDLGGGRPAAACLPDGRPVAQLGSGAAHLLDTGLLGGGTYAPGLLDKVQTEQLARLMGGPAMDSGWGLRTLSAKEGAYNPFGHH
ncbi:glycogen debranching protein, partial [Streptomyces sp. SID5785]|uniref:glycogen debranching N-terminal domain-containing protein n=1 Tax=Streptomyces sp. SID5785 TaxID=2690309 RepID=UPI001361EF96